MMIKPHCTGLRAKAQQKRDEENTDVRVIF